MILFFRTASKSVIATEVNHDLTPEDIEKLSWLYGDAVVEDEKNLKGYFIGPRREMITPWSTNAVEITQNMNIKGVMRIEEYFPVKDDSAEYDPMLQRLYNSLNQDIFVVNRQPAPIMHIENLEEYNEDLYGQFFKVSFVNKMRDEIKFNSLEDLRKQIEHDITNSYSFFKD